MKGKERNESKLEGDVVNPGRVDGPGGRIGRRKAHLRSSLLIVSARAEREPGWVLLALSACGCKHCIL